jgi:hypothetical protein
VKKFDASCGICAKEISTIKFNVKNHIMLGLPELPDPIETKLFLQGRDARIFSWGLLNEKLPISSSSLVILEVMAKLKKEFQNHLKITHLRFLCEIRRKRDVYNPVVTIKQKA